MPRDAKGELSIVIGQDSLQRPSGEAFVTFSSVEDSAKGLEYHLKNLGKRYIEIFPLFNKEYYRKSALCGEKVRSRFDLLHDLQEVWTHDGVVRAPIAEIDSRVNCFVYRKCIMEGSAVSCNKHGVCSGRQHKR